jgi:hypothetical protein
LFFHPAGVLPKVPAECNHLTEDRNAFQQTNHKTKKLRMKILRTFLAIGAVAALAISCSTTKQTESQLSAAGFKIVPAATPAQITHLNSLPPNKITMTQRNATTFFTYPDAKNKVLYVGQQAQYQEYQKLRQQQQMAEEQLKAEEGDARTSWEAWGQW